ncbi:hypothetical protein BCR42DRAFT_456530 [Absidia repens]|uniref:Uncharacterized protein n=1 Tax=Absidia repens TaxID=90262 RepID=A0A1X2HZT2_9FUNG|nr:hypothetical protein BCR42DRAFT_456530 [Absidia repens]
MLKMPSSTSKHDDAMSLLGTFLLQGWVMTDQLCSEESCSVPMMRSKDGVIQVCVLHDPLPTSNARNAPSTTTTTSTPATNHVATPSITSTVSTDDIEDDDNSIVVVEHTKQQQQPATTAATSGDDDEKTFKIQQERREQSSKASQLIGQKMLQRWALLNDTCPNDACYAIPLVRHPSNKTMYCVICEQTYQPEGAATAPPQQQQQPSTINSNISSSSNSNKEQKPTHTHEPSKQQQQPAASVVTHSPLGSPALDRSIKRQKKEDTAPATATTIEAPAPTSSSSSSVHQPPPPTTIPTTITATTTTTTHAAAARAATEKSMQSLTSKLSLLSDRIDQCGDPKDLVLLCQSLDACAKALGTCATTLDILA